MSSYRNDVNCNLVRIPANESAIYVSAEFLFPGPPEESLGMIVFIRYAGESIPTR
jgi:hypothetical protein